MEWDKDCKSVCFIFEYFTDTLDDSDAAWAWHLERDRHERETCYYFCCVRRVTPKHMKEDTGHMQWCYSVFPFSFLPFGLESSFFHYPSTHSFSFPYTLIIPQIMVSCIPCVHTKHATLVNHCYPPVKDGSTIPRSSELSYLTFYASSKPAKLTKVGSFIQKRVEKDIRKGRKS